MRRQNLFVRGYHGTTRDAANEILSGKDFEHDDRPWHWLGRGVYFWQDAPLRAWEWAVKKCEDLKRERGVSAEPAVVSVTLNIKDCLDLLDIEHWPLVNIAWLRAVEHRTRRGEPVPSQIGILETLARRALGTLTDLKKSSGHPDAKISIDLISALMPLVWYDLKVHYRSRGEQLPSEVKVSEALSLSQANPGLNRRDCEVIDMAVQLLREFNAPVTTVRAAFLEGESIYDGSYLFDRSHVQIAIIEPLAIPIIVSDPRLEDSGWLSKEYELHTRPLGPRAI